MSRRLFAALVPPPAVREETRRAAGHLRRAVPRLRARFADPDATHLTLAFLGQVEEVDVPAVALAVSGVARTSRRFTAHTDGLGAFPTERRPSVLWLGLDDEAGAMAALHRDLAEALGPVAGGPDDKRFVPHLTLARVRTLRGVDATTVRDALAGFAPTRAAWAVEELVLFQSELRPEGALHTAMIRAPLAHRGNDRPANDP